MRGWIREADADPADAAARGTSSSSILPEERFPPWEPIGPRRITNGVPQMPAAGDDGILFINVAGAPREVVLARDGQNGEVRWELRSDPGQGDGMRSRVALGRNGLADASLGTHLVDAEAASGRRAGLDEDGTSSPIGITNISLAKPFDDLVE